MKKNFFITPIGRAIFTTEETKKKRNTEAFFWVIGCLGVIVVIAQIVILSGR
jgi:uncharacterized membrane protein YdcZ (DUF606 family)